MILVNGMKVKIPGPRLFAATHLDRISHCKIASGTNRSNRWTGEYVSRILAAINILEATMLSAEKVRLKFFDERQNTNRVYVGKVTINQKEAP